MQLNSSIAAVVTGGASGLGGGDSAPAGRPRVQVALDLDTEREKGRPAEIGGVFCRVRCDLREEVEAGFAKTRAD